MLKFVYKYILISNLQLIETEQKTVDYCHDVSVLAQMMNSRETALSDTQNDLG